MTTKRQPKSPTEDTRTYTILSLAHIGNKHGQKWYTHHMREQTTVIFAHNDKQK
jgi:hypothetical protein